MNLEQQVCSLDLAKRLKELGVKQESYFFWYEIKNDADDSVTASIGKDDSYVGWGGKVYRAVVSAFTVAELGEMLPKDCWSGKMDDIYNNEVWGCGRPALGNTEEVIGQEGVCADTESDARAKMLIYLLENKLI